MPYLKIQLDNNVFQSREIIEAISIGRGEQNTNDLIIDDARCSRSHARIYMEGDQLILEDENSSYGTFVNDQRVDKKALQNNDVITIASQKIWYIEKELSPCQFVLDYRNPNLVDTNWMQVLKAIDVEFIVPTVADKITQAFTVLYEKINLLIKMGIVSNTFMNSIRSAASNAVKHGNQNHPQLCVFIRVTIVNNKLLVEIRDQGNGFEYTKELKKVKKSIEEHNKKNMGINEILKGADMVEWNLVGNQIKLWKNFSAQNTQLSHRDFEESVAVIRTKQNIHLI
ncbi:FHA domain-containing protein [Candidatus Uabimicrobium amorphum]|uniref:FHA domain-containing protein n=1 Tax=Uabimicrobium amorphum TaxID=2596890 RepID=A0A5S9IQI4_UABAM|nr:FHA domain-containing protein [Candidatus Uabimicrobium amorphum]BBM84835.1 FHA domain-containing protein [Candidatus Uabimicrobium amorphum]